MPTCPICGAETDGDADQCPECGGTVTRDTVEWDRRGTDGDERRRGDSAVTRDRPGDGGDRPPDGDDGGSILGVGRGRTRRNVLVGCLSLVGVAAGVVGFDQLGPVDVVGESGSETTTAGSPTTTTTTTPRATASPTDDPSGGPVTSSPGGTGDGPGAGTWSSYQFDAANTGSAAASVDGEGVSTDWTATGLSGYASSPVVSEGTVYTTDGTALLGLDAATGDRTVRVPAGAGDEYPLSVGPTVGDDAVYVVGRGVPLYACDPDDESVRWQFPAEGNARGLSDLSSAVVDDGTVYVGSLTTGAPRVFALDAATGEVLWETDGTEGGMSSSAPTNPALAGGRVVFPSGGGTYAYDAATGERRWQSTAGSGSSVTVGDGTVYLGSGGRGETVHAVDLATGETLWSGPGRGVLRRGLTNSPAVSGDLLVGTSFEGGIGALSTADGELRWERPTGQSHVPPAVVGDVVLAATNEGTLSGYRRSDGARLFGTGLTTGGPTAFAGLAYADGRVFVRTGSVDSAAIEALALS